MKPAIITIFLFIIQACSCNNSKKQSAADVYVVNKIKTSCACTVQTTTERPQLGDYFLGPFDSRQKAIDEMCKNVDNTMTDQKKCWTTKPDCQ